MVACVDKVYKEEEGYSSTKERVCRDKCLRSMVDGEMLHV